MLILLSGWKGSGKDTAADYLVRQHGFIKLAFAAALKDAVSETYGVPRHFFDDRTLKEKALLQFPVHIKDGFSEHVNVYMRGDFATKDRVTYHTPRSLCILEGSVKRSVDPNYWVKRALRGINTERGNYVIADWRYRSEFEAVRDLGLNPLTVRIERFESTASTDPSERDLDRFIFHTVIENKGPIDALKKALIGLPFRSEAA